MGRECKHSTSL